MLFGFRGLRPFLFYVCLKPKLHPRGLSSEKRLLGLVQLGREEGRAAGVRVVQQQQTTVRLLDAVLRGALPDPEDQRRLPTCHFFLEGALVKVP